MADIIRSEKGGGDEDDNGSIATRQLTGRL